MGTPPPPVLRVTYQGTGGGFLVLILKNLALTLVTLGIYFPWARAARRKYLWQNVDVGGHRLRYHATGRELLIGYLKVAGAIAVAFGLPWAVTTVSPVAGIVLQIVLLLAFAAMIPVAIFGARRYLLSRTSWRGVHFGLDGSASAFWSEYVTGYLLVPLTLGFRYPAWRNQVHSYLTCNMRYGSERFHYDGSDGEAFKVMVFGYLLSIVTLGLYSPWYAAAFLRFHVNHLTFQGARARLDLTGLDVLKLGLALIVGSALTLGIGFPWIFTHVMRTGLSKLSFVGAMDFSRIHEQASEGSAAAEGLAGALDIGLEI
jgi:uncharacterized membrane protein YjgN (DUF898 family)